MLAFGHNIDKMVEFIAASMAQPLMIIFSLFFGGGLINSFKNGGRGWAQEVQVNQSKREPAKTIFTNPAPVKELSRREKRQLRRQERKSK